MRRDVGLEASSGGERARSREADPVRALSSDQLLRFLMTRRWFGAKGREPEYAQIVNAVPIGSVGWLARVDVGLRDGIERYQLTLRGQGSGVRSQGGELVDGLEDEAFRRALGEAIARGATLEGSGVRWVVEWIGKVPDELPAPRLAGAEQSNTSLTFGDYAIMKLYRRLERGEHPDAEIARFLCTRAHFPHTPALLATARFESPGGTEVAAMLQRFLPGSRDAWSVALERGRQAFSVEAPPRIPFAVEAETLGDVTRAMHEALASDETDPAFAPEQATTADVSRWADAVRRESERALSLLERGLRSGGLSRNAIEDAEVVLRRRQELDGWVEGWLSEIGEDVGARIRHHGDYHLGQVLHTTSSGFMVIDFEGEPARPLEERRVKHSALRDVAGMLRSFSYAAATCAEAAREDLGEAEALKRANRWNVQMRDAFLRGYLPDGRQHPAFLPQARVRLDVLLQLFETEKVFYELAYELNNRPTWVSIPLGGVVSLLRELS